MRLKNSAKPRHVGQYKHYPGNLSELEIPGNLQNTTKQPHCRERNSENFLSFLYSIVYLYLWQ